MKLTIKTLKQNTYEVEIDENDTVETLKKKVEEVTQNELSSTTMNLIYAGKILHNDKTLKYYNIRGTRFVVAMTKRDKKDENENKRQSPKKTEEGTDNKSDEETPKSDEEEKLNPHDENAASALEGPTDEETINNIATMGYTIDEVRRAFHAANCMAERTIEYLVHGFPPYMDNFSRESNTPESSIPSPQPGDLWYIDPHELDLRREREGREIQEDIQRREEASRREELARREERAREEAREQEEAAIERVARAHAAEYAFEPRQDLLPSPPNILDGRRNLWEPVHPNFMNGRSPPIMYPHHMNHVNIIHINNPQPQRIPTIQINRVNRDNVCAMVQNLIQNPRNNANLYYQGYNLNQVQNPNLRELRNDPPFEFLRNDPRFLQIRQMVASNQDFMRSLLLDIASNNRQLLLLINEKLDEFTELINEPYPRRIVIQNGHAAGENGNAAGQNGNVVGQNGNALRLNGNAARGLNGNGALVLSSADRAAIERLSTLGFTEELCLEAYLACEKNEELAGNYLFSQNSDSD